MSELKCPCRFQIPLFLNDGTEVPPETMDEIFAVLDRQFSGYTLLGVREGVWNRQREPSIWVEVAIGLARVPELKEVVCSIGKRLGQAAMYFDAPPPTVEIIQIDDHFRETPADK